MPSFGTAAWNDAYCDLVPAQLAAGLELMSLYVAADSRSTGLGSRFLEFALTDDTD